MPSESCRRRRKQRISERHITSRGLESQLESVRDDKFEEITGQKTENPVAADSKSSNGSNTETILGSSAISAEPSNLQTIPIWRIPGPCTPPRTSGLFSGKKETLGITQKDFKYETAPTKTTVYIPPHLRNRCDLASTSLIQIPDVKDDGNSNSENAVEAVEDFLDLDLVAIYQETTDQINKNDDNLDPLTNYIAAGNFGLCDLTRSLPPLETLANSNVVKTGDLVSNAVISERQLKISEVECTPKVTQVQENFEDLNLDWKDLTNKLLNENKLSVNSTPGIYVYPERMVNFAHARIQFAIKALNIPDGINLTPDMFESVAKSPSGILLTCIVTNDMDTTSCTIRMMENLRGQFTATEETGLYHLKVRLPLPLTKYRQSFGVLVDESEILVSKNYFEESEKTLTSVLHLKRASKGNLFQNGGESPSFATNSWGLACDKATNRLFYTDTGGKVACLDPETGRHLTNFDQRQYYLNRPTGIAVDEIHRRVFVCDNNHHRICYYTVDGQFLGTFGGPGSQIGMFRFPWDIDVSPLGTHVAVSDTGNNRLQLFDIFGNVLSQQFSGYPLGISFGHDGQNIYTSDYNTGHIQQVPVSMQNWWRLNPERQLLRPQGLLVDSTGSILVADTRNHCINQMAFNGAHLSTVSHIGGTRLHCPVNLAMMQNGRVAVMDVCGRIWSF